MTKQPDLATWLAEPEKWPRWPLLCLKRGKGKAQQFGAILATWEGLPSPLKVVLVPETILHHEAFDSPNAKYLEYQDVTHLLRDGWEVD